MALFQSLSTFPSVSGNQNGALRVSGEVGGWSGGKGRRREGSGSGLLYDFKLSGSPGIRLK